MILYYFLFVFPVVAGLSALLYLPYFLCGRKKRGKQPWQRHLSIYCLIGIVLSILYLTIGFFGIHYLFTEHPYHFLNLTPFVWVKETYEMGFAKMIWQLMMNLIMFAPLGFLLPVAHPGCRKWWKTTLSIAFFVMAIETLQYFIGRSADIDDLIMNTLGGLIGYGLYTGCNRLFGDKPFWRKACGLTNEKEEIHL